MKDLNRIVLLKALVLKGWSVLLIMITGFLGAIPLYSLRISLEKKHYYYLSGASFIALILFKVYIVAFSYVVLLLMLETFEFVSDKVESLFMAAFTSLYTSVLFVLLSFGVMTLFNQEFYNSFLTKIDEVIGLLAKNNMALFGDKKAMDILYQVPSGIITLLMVSLFCALYFNQTKIYLRGVTSKNKVWALSTFRLPDIFVWVFIGALFGKFYQYDIVSIKIVCSNLFYILSFGYFFQGMAIVTTYFNAVQLSSVWRSVWTLLIVLNLFVAVVILGVSDFWFNYRTMMAKKLQKLDKRV